MTGDVASNDEADIRRHCYTCKADYYEQSKERLDTAPERAKKALKQDELGELNAARDELMQAFSAAGQQFYQAQAAEQAPPEGAEPGAPGADAPDAEAGATAGVEEDVVEADYEIVDEEK